MNVKLLRKVQKHIVEEPKRFLMGRMTAYGNAGEVIEVGSNEWNAGNPYESRQTFADCGTAACILGWMRILAPKGYRDRTECEELARLCSARQWPEKFRARYGKAQTPLTRARIASERIDHFIKTKGRE